MYRSDCTTYTASLMACFIDAAYRVVYIVAYRTTLVWFFITRRPTSGAAIAVRHHGRFLLVLDSYRGLWSLPGGGIGRNEYPATAAARELAEETGIYVSEHDVARVGVFKNFWEYHLDTVHVFETTLSVKPALRLDNREIVDARWVAEEEAHWLPLVPHTKNYLSQRSESQTTRHRD
jgi:8-oxo-dGTP diphosphatase